MKAEGGERMWYYPVIKVLLAIMSVILVIISILSLLASLPWCGEFGPTDMTFHITATDDGWNITFLLNSDRCAHEFMGNNLSNYSLYFRRQGETGVPGSFIEICDINGSFDATNTACFHDADSNGRMTNGDYLIVRKGTELDIKSGDHFIIDYHGRELP